MSKSDVHERRAAPSFANRAGVETRQSEDVSRWPCWSALAIAAAAPLISAAAAPAPSRADLDWAAGFAKTVVRYCPEWRLTRRPDIEASYSDPEAKQLPVISPALWNGVLSATSRHSRPAFCARFPRRCQPVAVQLR